MPRILLLIVALTLSIVGYQQWTRSNTGPEENSVPAEDPQFSVDPAVPEAIADQVQEVAPPTLIDEPGCLTMRQFQELPELIQDTVRMESVSANGVAMSGYESLTEDTLRNFAEQGDAAAMVIIGAISVMRAYQTEESMALEWLNHGHRINDLDSGKEQLSSAASLALNDAAYWFYEAALRGRLFALQNYGQVRGRLFGGPVGLGWISREDYAGLSVSEKTSLVPSNLYGQVAYDIAPALREGALGGLSRMVPQSEIQHIIRRELVTEFEQTLVDAGLPTIEVAATASAEELIAQVCGSEIQREKQRLSLE